VSKDNHVKKIVFNLVQDIATPHNNILIEQLAEHPETLTNLWYAQRQDISRYQWATDINGVNNDDAFYGNRLNFNFLWKCIRKKRERFVIVGWMNTNTRLLHFIFFCIRRPYNHWTDNPNPMLGGMGFKDRALRWLAYKILKFSRCKVFCVGKTTIDYFKSIGFSEDRLVNLPIFVNLENDKSHYLNQRTVVREHYNIPADCFMLSAGSRLIKEKGYDLLIQAISELPINIRQCLHLIIVGSGAESDNLHRKAVETGLKDQVHFDKWLEIEDFKTLIACSDIFLHPARFDSYGGTTLGMALGVPVVGSTGAGAAVDRIEHGVNGFLYAPDDTQALGYYISQLISDPELRARIGAAGRQTALKWHPRRGVETILHNSV
jgi:glycosyltransferase involved in cell wall biosynthesis